MSVKDLRIPTVTLLNICGENSAFLDVCFSYTKPIVKMTIPRIRGTRVAGAAPEKYF